MSNLDIFSAPLPFLLSLWSLVGIFVWGWIKSYPADIKEDEITIPQLIFFRFLCGPLVWVYGFWRLLGLWGRKS